ncbi:MAG: ATP-dependent endonuclease [Actinomycetota bacterium]
MRVSFIQVTNFRGFSDSGAIELGARATVLIGPNNSGKSTLIRGLHFLQSPNILSDDVRIGAGAAQLQIGLTDLDTGYLLPDGREIFAPQGPYVPTVLIRIPKLDPAASGSNAGLEVRTAQNSDGRNIQPSRASEPANLIIPYLSRRKAVAFSEAVNAGAALSVSADLTYLNAKVDRLANPYHPSHPAYNKACDDILGFRVGAVASVNGKKAAIIVDETNSIPLEALGEGVSNLLGLITNLCIAKHKLFLIEEPENDIHPQALKGLLNLMIESSEHNQFVVSTHSNIVLKHLGSISGSRIYQVTFAWDGGMPLSEMRIVGESSEDRWRVLEELGYDPFDLSLWEGWLFLEESSAERIIREYLIPWFVPELANRLRTVAAGGVSRVEARFDDFDRLFLFVHLAPLYRNRAWVLVDGGENGQEVISRLKDRYQGAGWEERNFVYFQPGELGSAPGLVDSLCEDDPHEKGGSSCPNDSPRSSGAT